MFETKTHRKIAAYALAVPGRSLWSDLIAESGLLWPDDDSEEHADVRPGIWLATRGMPCGIRIDTPAGLPGWWSSLFVLLEDPEMSFDVGRKSPVGGAARMYARVARDLFNELRNVNLFEHLRDRPDRPWGKGGKGTQITELVGIPPLPQPAQDLAGFVLPPQQQEGAVAGMFFHLVGRGHLKGYRFLRCSYSDSYDVYLRFTIPKDEIEGASSIAYRASDVSNGVYSEDLVAEFKYRADSVIGDIKDDRKRFEDFKILICWTFDRAAFERAGVKVYELDTDSRLYPGCRYGLDFHRLIGSDDPKLLLCLSEVLNVDAAQFK